MVTKLKIAANSFQQQQQRVNLLSAFKASHSVSNFRHHTPDSAACCHSCRRNCRLCGQARQIQTSAWLLLVTTSAAKNTASLHKIDP